MIKIGVLGCGHWGPNHIRVFNQLPHSQVSMCTDLDEGRLKTMKTLYPALKVTTNYKDILKDKDIDAVCIATPTNTHFAFTKEALEAGKHVICEKPLTLKGDECLLLKDLADRSKKILMVGHVFVYHQAIQKLKEYIRSGELGRIHYAYSERTHLGPFRYDVNALWDLAPHDIAIFNFLLEGCPVNVSARGAKCLGTSLEDLAFASLEYPGHILVNVHVSWLAPKKVRQITIIGDRKMVVWDDLDNLGPIHLYDKHVEKTSKYYETYGEFQLLSREGSVLIPKIDFHEPLKIQAQYFLDCVEKNKNPDFSDAGKAYEVVTVLQAIQRSMDHLGAPETIQFSPAALHQGQRSVSA